MHVVLSSSHVHFFCNKDVLLYILQTAVSTEYNSIKADWSSEKHSNLHTAVKL